MFEKMKKDQKFWTLFGISLGLSLFMTSLAVTCTRYSQAQQGKVKSC